MSEIKLNKATFKGKTRYFESTSKSMKESSDMWQYELNGDELVTLKDGREGTLGGLIYDEDNTFIGYEFSENPYGGYNYEEIKPEDIEKVSDIYADEDLMEALNEISRESAKLHKDEFKINEAQEQFKIYIYDETTGELSDILIPESFQNAQTILYNLSDKNNGMLVFPKPLDTTTNNAKEKSDDFKIKCSHIYQNNGNFLRMYGDWYFSKNKNESKINESDKYHHLGKDGELLTPEESNSKMCKDPISTVKNTNKSGNVYFTASYSCGGLEVTRNGRTEEAARKALKKVLKTKHDINLDEAEIKGNNLDSKWVIRAWVDNMDSEDGYDEIEFTKIGLIDFINSEEEKYYGDSYDYQTEPIEYDITDEELKIAINDGVFTWSFGDTASVVSIDGNTVNESKLNEGVLGAKVVKDTLEDIEFIVEFDDADETTYQVECYLVGDDTDTYSIRVYDNLHSEVNPYNANEVMHGLFDSDGGSFDGMEVEIGENDPNFDRMGELEDFILDIIFNDHNGLMTKYQGEHSDRLAESFKFNKVVGLDKKTPKFNVGDKVKVGKEIATIERVVPMNFSDTPTYKIKLDDGSVIDRYEEEISMAESKMNEALDSTIRIFLTNLGKYNEGELVGEWVELPVDDFAPILDRIGINDEYEEWFITDYEAPFPIGEYDNIEELNEIAQEIEDFGTIELEVLKVFEENGYDMREAIEKVRDNEYLYIEGQTEEDLAYNYIDMIGSFEDAISKENQEMYFDYDAFGRDLVLGGDYSYVDDVVDLNEFPDKDTAEMIFGSYGENKPSEEDLNKYRQWIEIYGNYDESQEEQLAEQGIEVFMSQIYVDEVGYDVETLEQVVNGDYETKTGYQDNEGYVVEVYSERELAEYIVDSIYGSLSELGEDTLQTYFDYEAFGRDLSYDFYQTDNGWVDIN